MGFFDRLLGRKGEGEKDSGEPSLSMKTFRKFQEETQDGMRHMRGEFNKLVEENHTLKKQVLSVTNRLDAIQREQLQQRNETKKGLSDLNKSIVEMGGKAKPDISAMDGPQADAQPAQPPTQKQSPQAVAPGAAPRPQQPQPPLSVAGSVPGAATRPQEPQQPLPAADAPKPQKKAPEAAAQVDASKPQNPASQADDQADDGHKRMASAQTALSSLNGRLTAPSVDASKSRHKP